MCKFLKTQTFAAVFLALTIISMTNAQGNPFIGLQQYYGQNEIIKPVQEENEESEDVSRYYRAEPSNSVAQATLQFSQQSPPTQGIQYVFQSPAVAPNFQQQQLEPQSFYQQQQLLPQTLYQQQGQAPAQPLPQQQLRSLQGFADPQFQQDYKYRMIYAAQVNPTPPPPPPAQPQPAPLQPQQAPFQQQPQFQQQPAFQQLQQQAPQGFAQPSPFQIQPQQLQAQPDPFSPPQQQLSQLIRPAPQSPQLGVSFSSAGAVSKTSFSGNGVSYSYGGF